MLSHFSVEANIFQTLSNSDWEIGNRNHLASCIMNVHVDSRCMIVCKLAWLEIMQLIPEVSRRHRIYLRNTFR